MIEPKDHVLGGKTYVLGKFPATVGREILMQYPTSAIPKVGDYATNHAMMLRIMSHVGVRIDGQPEPLMLTTEALVNNHVPNGETLVKLEFAMISHNFDFFGDGRALGFLDSLTKHAQLQISQILTQFVQPLSGKG
jgi:hypothetical protein